MYMDIAALLLSSSGFVSVLPENSEYKLNK
ncbi:Hypothetical protein CpCP13_0931 [Corynebacterium pseudotuberculosis]|nr:Hypothetical protein Cp4202_0902 [Corynebacterium pseudotuberculosis 42/02-A]AER68970.1 Hypothetical protein Cp106_0897 [Corynebacterium pseudotuberculosis 1/06-A]AFH51851.1 Hypothetical protein Cp267_0951 [Corynebacterium pseudotuberculosis 267]AJC13649.1 hypothetical protein CpVD57_0932 [Corynebacterium pseudotuberculosis]ANQ77102.1 Hypothetical protein CpCP13_0931 [Corynebacterium pseudotuberculosis]